MKHSFLFVLLCFLALGMAKPACAQIVVGDEGMIAKYDFGLLWNDSVQFVNVWVLNRDRHFYYGRDGNFEEVWFAPDTVGMVQDSVQFQVGYVDGNLHETAVKNITVTFSGYGIPDTTISIRPHGIVFELVYDTTKNIWTGSTRIQYKNPTTFNASISAIRLQIDTALHTTFRVKDSLGAVVSGLQLSPHSRDSLELDFSTRNGSSLSDQTFSGNLLSRVISHSGDSVYDNPVSIVVYAPPLNSRMSVDTSHLTFSDPSYTSDVQRIHLTLDPRLSSVTFSSLHFPFSARIVDSTFNRMTIEVVLAPTSSASYNENLSINYTLRDFQGASRPGVFIVSIHAIITNHSENPFWERTAFPPDSNLISLEADNRGYLYAYGSGLFKIGNEGNTSQRLIPTSGPIADLSMAPSNSIVILTHGGIVKSDIDQTYWDTLKLTAFAAVVTEIFGTHLAKFTPMSVLASDSLIITAGYYDGYIYDETANQHHERPARFIGFFGTSNLGDTWVNSSLIRSLSPDEWKLHTYADTGIIAYGIAGIYGHASFPVSAITTNSLHEIIAGTPGSGIVLNRNGWKTTGLFGQYIMKICTASNGDIFAATSDDGVFRSTDNGTTWFGVNAGLDSRYIVSMAVTPQGRLYALLKGGELFRSKEKFMTNAVGSVPSPTWSSSDIQLYPNPANEKVTVSSNLPFPELQVVDQLGRVVRVFQGKEFDVRGLANGLYYVTSKSKRLQAVRLVVQH